MSLNGRKYRNHTIEGMREMSYTIQLIERREFYTYIHANLNGIPRISLWCITLTLVAAVFTIN